MSCFILRDESIAAIAAMLDQITGSARWSGCVRYGVYNGYKLYFQLSQEWETITGRRCVELDTEKIYTVLHRMNAAAYCERYRTKVADEPSELPDGNWSKIVDQAPWQLLKSLECFMYQCDEGEINKSELYQELIHVKDNYMQYLINKIPEYDAAIWG